MENKNMEKLSDNAEVYRAISAFSRDHCREGISSDGKFLKDMWHYDLHLFYQSSVLTN